MVEMLGFEWRWQPLASLKRLQYYCQLSMSRWNNVNGKPINSNGWNWTHRPKSLKDQGRKLWRPHWAHSSSLKIDWVWGLIKLVQDMVHNLIFKVDLFLLGRLYKTLFGHLIRRLFNYARLLIQTLQILILDSKPMYLSSGFKRLFLNYGLESYAIKSSEVPYHLELEAKEDCVIKRQKGKRQHSWK